MHRKWQRQILLCSIPALEKAMLTRAEKDTYRKRLEALRVRLSRAETQLKGEALQATGGEASGGLSDLPIHPADLGSHQYEETLALDLLENEGHLLDEIEAALDRLDDGTFGRCEICKKTL